MRLAPRLAEARFGDRQRITAKLLVVTDGTTNRRRIDRMDAVMGTAYPSRGAGVRAWLSDPRGPLAGVLFLAGAADRLSKSRRRVRSGAA